MESEILKMIAGYGIFAILFCYLLFYVLKENSRRERNYQDIIAQLTNVLPTIKQDLDEIKEKIFRR